MTSLTSQQMLQAFDTGLERASRWPRLLKALGFEPAPQKPTARQINAALQRHGFKGALDDSQQAMPESLPDSSWTAIALAVTGRGDASVDDVISRLRASRAVAE
jgi:hypothetical protein